MAEPAIATPRTEGVPPAYEPRLGETLSSSGPRTISFSLSQAIVMWSVIAGTMIAVFLFGLFAGREQGLREALEAQEKFAARVPLDSSAVDETFMPALPAPVPAPLGSTATPLVAQTTTLTPESTKLTEPQLVPPSAHIPTPAKLNTPSVAAAPSVTTKVEATDSLAMLDPKRTVTEAVEPKPIVEPPAKVAPPAPKPAPVAKEEKTKISTGTPPKGWYVQIAAAKTLDEAERYISKVRGLGMKVRMEQISVKNTKFYRVMAGPYTSQAGAQGAQAKIRDAKISPSTPFTKRVP